MNPQTRGTIEMTSAMVISGTIGYFVLQSGQPVMDVVFWRCFFGALTLLAVCAAMGLLRGLLNWRTTCLAALGGMAIVINWVLLFSAFSRASISIATAVYNVQPFILVALGALFLGERITSNKLMWLCTAFVGMLLVVQTKPGATYVGTDYLMGIVMALGAACFWAIAALITKKLTGTPPHLIALIQVCVGMVMLAPFANWAQPPQGNAWVWLISIGVVHTGLMYILLYGAIHKLPTYLQGSLSFIYPVVAILVDYLVFDHRLHPLQLIGAAIILIAAAGINLGWSWQRLMQRA
jgi:RarD protein